MHLIKFWEVHALGSALGMGPKARMGEKPAASSRLVIVITVLISGEPRVSATSTISIPPRGLRLGMWGYINKSWRPPVPSGRAPRAQQRLRHSPSAAHR